MNKTVYVMIYVHVSDKQTFLITKKLEKIESKGALGNLY